MSTLAADSDPWGLLAPARSPAAVLGRTEPRLWTPPLRELTPETSYGFGVCEFAARTRRPLDPWQEWLVIHAGELLPDGRPRFRRVLVLVSRQNGKTEVLVVLTLFWLFEERRPMVFGTSTNLDYAKESWQKVRELAEDDPELAARIPARGGIRETNGEQTLLIQHPCPDCVGAECEACRGSGQAGKSRYKIGASNRRGGRSLTIDRLISDEVREQDTYAAYNAGVHAMRAVFDAQAFFISNQGDDRAVVLDDLREAALTFITEGTGDPRLGLFEWSAPEGADVEDVDALAQANPNLERRGLDLDTLLGEARTAKAAGGEALAGFKTEAMCMRVPKLDPAVDPNAWRAGADPQPMDDLRDRIALCVDVALDGSHAGLLAAAMEPGGRVRIEVVAVWTGAGCTAQLRRELPGQVAKVRPRVIGWIPNGPAAVVAADLADPAKRHKRRAAWPPPGVKVEEIRTDVPAVCMGFADLVANGMIAHPDDPLLNKQVESTAKLWTGGKTWVFAYGGAGPVNLTYAAAGAVHLARTLPPSVGKPRLVVAR